MISLYPLLHPRSPMRTWMSQSRAAHPPRSLRSTGSRAAHSPPRSPWSTGSRAAHSPPRSPGAPGRGPRILLPGPPGAPRRGPCILLPSPPGAPRRWPRILLPGPKGALGRPRSLTKAVCYSLFCALWKQLTPQVVVTRPMSDLCWMCQQNSTLIMRAHNRPVEEKSEVNIIHVHYFI